MKHKNVYLIGSEDLTFEIIERIINDGCNGLVCLIL